MRHLLIPSFINWCLWQLLFAWTFVSYKTTNLAMFLVWLVLLLLNLTGSAVLLAWVQNNGHIYFQNQYWERFVTMITNLYSTIAIYKFVPKNAKKKDIWVRQKPQTPTRPSILWHIHMDIITITDPCNFSVHRPCTSIILTVWPRFYPGTAKQVFFLSCPVMYC